MSDKTTTVNRTVITYEGNDFKICQKEEEGSLPLEQDNVGQNGNILANQFELVRNILRFLSMKELLNCSKVNNIL